MNFGFNKTVTQVNIIVNPSMIKINNGICASNVLSKAEASTPTPIVISPFTLIGTKNSKIPMKEGMMNFHMLCFVSPLFNVVISFPLALA